MEFAGAFVQAYLRVNGFLTVTEYPILHRNRDGSFREATDMDMLAMRLPGAGRVLPRPHPIQGQKLDMDPILDLRHDRCEFIIAEVKEGMANPNRVLLHEGVLHECLRRFGCGRRDEQRKLVTTMQKTGSAIMADGSRIRLILFGSKPGIHMEPCAFVPLSHVVKFLQSYLDAGRKVYGQMRFRDPALSMLTLLYKADQWGIQDEDEG